MEKYFLICFTCRFEIQITGVTTRVLYLKKPRILEVSNFWDSKVWNNTIKTVQKKEKQKTCNCLPIEGDVHTIVNYENI